MVRTNKRTKTKKANLGLNSFQAPSFREMTEKVRNGGGEKVSEKVSEKGREREREG